MPPQEGSPIGNISNISEEFSTESLPVGWPWKLLVAAIVIFGLTVFAYVGLKAGYETSLNAQSKAIDTQISQLGQQVSNEDRDRFITFYSQIANLQKVLQSHPFSSNIFTFLERSSLPTLYFTEATGKVSDGTLNLKGIADTFDTVAAQVGIFQKQPEIATVLLSSVDLQPGSVSFSIDLKFIPTFFDKPTI